MVQSSFSQHSTCWLLSSIENKVKKNKVEKKVDRCKVSERLKDGGGGGNGCYGLTVLHVENIHPQALGIELLIQICQRKNERNVLTGTQAL